MTGKYANWIEDNGLDKAIASGDNNLLMGNLAFAISIKDVDSETSNKVLMALADANMPEAHIQLYKRYGSGDSLPQDRDKALAHLVSAAELGDKSAMAQVAAEYQQEGSYFQKGPILVDINLDEAKRWHRRAAESGNTWSCEKLADLLLDGRMARDCSREDLKEIESLYLRAGKYFKLGSIYCTDKFSGDFSENEVNTARKWYGEGRTTPRRDAESKECNEILRRWGEPDLAAQQPKNSISLMEILLAPVALVLWSVIGITLLGLALSISAVTFPAILIGAVVLVIYKAFRARQK